MEPARQLGPRGEPPLGTVLAQRFQLVSKFYARGELRYRARDLRHPGQDVELVITGFNGGHYGYQVKSRSRHAHRPRLLPSPTAPLPENEQALDEFAERVMLTGVSLLHGERVIFSGYDRRSRRPVRVVIEEV